MREFYWPVIAQVLHIPPYEFDRLSVEDVDAAVDFIRQMNVRG